MSRSSKAKNNFVYVQSGVTQSNACILNEFAINTCNPTISARLQCGMPCYALSQCVGADIIGGEAKRFRLLYAFLALTPTPLTAPKETVRYQKVIYMYTL